MTEKVWACMICTPYDTHYTLLFDGEIDEDELHDFIYSTGVLDDDFDEADPLPRERPIDNQYYDITFMGELVVHPASYN